MVVIGCGVVVGWFFGCFGVRLFIEKDFLFFYVKLGMIVVVKEVDFWWMGDVIDKEGGVRDLKVFMLF